MSPEYKLIDNLVSRLRHLAIRTRGRSLEECAGEFTVSLTVAELLAIHEALKNKGEINE